MPNYEKLSPEILDRIREDIAAVRERDPAAKSALEIFFLYPGVKAIRMYRRAHFFYTHNMPFVARWISQRAARKTGIEIHPGAKIGRRLVIDHGHGVVIGETATVADNCTIYHGVTLGGTGKDTGKRHPTLGNNVLIGAGTKVLGPVYIVDNVRVGAGSVVLRNLPANAMYPKLGYTFADATEFFFQGYIHEILNCYEKAL